MQVTSTTIETSIETTMDCKLYVDALDHTLHLVSGPWCWRVHIANNDCCTHDTRGYLTCCATENFLLIVTYSALISLTLGMVGTAGEGITTARRYLGETKTISIALTSFRRRLFELICLISSAHDPRFDAMLTNVICKLYHRIARCKWGKIWSCDNVRDWSQLSNLGWCWLRSW